MVAFEAVVSLLVTNSKATILPLPQVERFDFPILGEIEDEIDWNTRRLDMNVQAWGRSACGLWMPHDYGQSDVP